MNEGTSNSNSGSMAPLRTKISLKSGTVVPPFYTFKMNLPPHSEIQGNHDLLTSYGLGPVEGGFSGSRRVKENISSFLPHIIGEFHFGATQDSSSLRTLLEKPPIHKEISNLSSSSMQGFKLSAGPVDERYRHLFERRKEDGVLTFSEKLNVLRVRAHYDPYGFDEDETERAFPRKHKKKKKDKKRKNKDKDNTLDPSERKKKKGEDHKNQSTPMDF